MGIGRWDQNALWDQGGAEGERKGRKSGGFVRVCATMGEKNGWGGGMLVYKIVSRSGVVEYAGTYARARARWVQMYGPDGGAELYEGSFSAARALRSAWPDGRVGPFAIEDYVKEWIDVGW